MFRYRHRLDPTRSASIRLDSIRLDLIRSDSVLSNLIRSDSTRFFGTRFVPFRSGATGLGGNSYRFANHAEVVRGFRSFEGLWLACIWTKRANEFDESRSTNFWLRFGCMFQSFLKASFKVQSFKVSWRFCQSSKFQTLGPFQIYNTPVGWWDASTRLETKGLGGVTDDG